MSSAPAQLLEVAERTSTALRRILHDEVETWRTLDETIATPLLDLAEFVEGGGKRIRPAYCHWGFVAGGGDPGSDDALAACCAVELLQAFALVHDDVMDGSPTRRGHPTVWVRFIDRHRAGAWHGEDRRFGEAAAVLVGDMAMVLADRALGAATPAVRRVWDDLRTELNMGQYLDVVGTARGDVGTDQAHTIMRNKTAGYTIVRPLQLGAALRALCEREELSGVHINFCPADEVEALGEQGWMQRVGLQYHWHNADYGSFDDYLAHLKSKRRNQVRRERRSVREAGVETQVLRGDSIPDEIFEPM